ncbi:sialic acid synthase [Drosophila albomicans]|uniref:N-acetylneuraminate-9-phosphate synthase n=1 Tax=Drosophila albomicans TaxID=7291 RepID=A0A6P8XIS8_DROAB|nr:sialic acid synthase [Drosophila albomicans]
MLLLDIITKNLSNEVYIIAEIGQNHQGSLETAKLMILEAKKAGCHCVKFQKSDLRAKFTRFALEREYVSDHAWGRTYGEHKEYLEFSKEQYRQLQAYSKEIKIDFTASAMDEKSLDFLAELKVPFIKIGSGDANNFPMLKKAAAMRIPLVISTGMQTVSTVDKIVEIMKQAGNNLFALMHCVSSYPTASSDCNLRMIPAFMTRFPGVTIGYSGHELGVSISKAAVLSGARIVERHFTLDKNQKGSDHRCSLEPIELLSLVEGINQFKANQTLCKPSYTSNEITQILDEENDELKVALAEITQKEILQSELACRRKLGKSIVGARNLLKGHKLQEVDLSIKVSEPNGITAEKYFDLIGMQLLCDVNEDEPITENVLA